MANVSVYNMEGNEVGTLELNDAVFGVNVNEHLVHLAVVSQLANKRQGTQKAKTRSEVSGGGRKPWKQTGFNKISTVDRRRSSICSNTKRLHDQTEQEGKKACVKVCPYKQSEREQVHRC